jgi:AAA domain-containing protein
VILDATYSLPAERAAIRRLGRRMRAPTYFIVCTAQESGLQARLAARVSDAASTSDARPELWPALRAAYVSPTELAEATYVDTSHAVGELLEQLLAEIRHINTALVIPPRLHRHLLARAVPFASHVVRTHTCRPDHDRLRRRLYDRTQSLLLVMLMHASLVFSTFVLGPIAIDGVPIVIYGFAIGVGMWLVVGIVDIFSRGALIGRRAATLQQSSATTPVTLPLEHNSGVDCRIKEERNDALFTNSRVSGAVVRSVAAVRRRTRARR